MDKIREQNDRKRMKNFLMEVSGYNYNMLNDKIDIIRRNNKQILDNKDILENKK